MSTPKAYLIMDGAWGSCGKGSLAGKLALDRRPDVVVCNFGPNAGHTFVFPAVIGEEPLKVMTQQLPTGCVNKDATLLIGPGAMVDPKILMAEIEALDPQFNIKNRLRIHPRAAIVLPIDKSREEVLVAIGSTRKGTGSSAARKLLRADGGIPRTVAEYGQELDPFVITEHQYDDIIATANLIQIESAQGIELSLNRGFSYPTCTGRDISPEQVLNDVAVPMRFLDHTCLVVRTFPIRVGNEYDKDGQMIGHSGPVYRDQEELSWNDLSKMAGVELLERTTVTKKVRRIFTFSFQQFGHALWVAGPCNIFLNYMNYLDPEAKRLMGSNLKARDFLAQVEAFAQIRGSKVAWLGWGPAYNEVEAHSQNQMVSA